MILVTGGCRSGKSAFAEDLVTKWGQRVLYIATAIAFDDEMKKRVESHKIRRPSHWDTYEGYLDLPQVIEEKAEQYDGILLDCITIWITNLLFSFSDTDNPENMDFQYLEKKILEEAKRLIKALQKTSVHMIVVTNEVGLGIIPENPLSRHFCDIAGKVNQYLANYAKEVYLMVSGIPMKIKGGQV